MSISDRIIESQKNPYPTSIKDLIIEDINSILKTLLTEDGLRKVYLETEDGIKLRSDVHDVIVTLYTKDDVKPGKTTIKGNVPTALFPTLVTYMTHGKYYDDLVQMCSTYDIEAVAINVNRY